MAITTGRVANPYMDAMSTGGQLANQSMGVASQFGSNAIKSFDSAGNLAFKLDSLLQEAEAQRHNQMLDIQNSLTKQFQHQQEMEFNYKKQQFAEQQHNENLNFSYEKLRANEEQHETSLEYNKQRDKDNLNNKIGSRNIDVANRNQNNEIKSTELWANNQLSSLESEYGLTIKSINSKYTKTDVYGNKHIVDQEAHDQEVLKAEKIFNDQVNSVKNEFYNQMNNVYGIKQQQSTNTNIADITLPSVEEKEKEVVQETTPITTIDQGITPRSFSSVMTFEQGRPMIASGTSADDQYIIKTMAKNIPATEGSFAILDQIANLETLDLEQVKKYGEGLISLKQLTDFDVSEQLNAGQQERVEGFIALGLLSKNKLDESAATSSWREAYSKDPRLGDSMLVLLNGMDESKQKAIIGKINDPVLNKRIKTQNDYKSNPENYVFDEELIEEIAQSAVLKNILGFGSSEKNNGDFLNSANNVRHSMLIKEGGVDLVGYGMKSFAKNISSKTGIFMEGYDTQSLSYDFGKALVGNEDISLLVSQAMTGEANPKYLEELYKNISARKSVMDRKKLKQEVDMLGYTPESMSKELNTEVIVYDEIIKTLQADPEVWEAINSMIYESAVDYASGRNVSHFNEMSSALIGAKVASVYNEERGNEGISSFVDSVLNNFFD